MNSKLQLTDPSFQTQLAGKCDLHLEIFPGGVHAAVVDKGQDQLKSLLAASAENLEELKEFIASEHSLSYHFRKVKVSIHTQKFTFIPDDLFDKALLGEYAKFIAAAPDEVLFSEHLRSAKCNIVFAVDEELVQLINAKFKQPHFYPAAAACIEAAAQWAKNAEQPLILLNVLSETFEAACFVEGKLACYNSFPKRTADEFNYFLLALLDGLQLDPSATEFILAGEANAETAERLEKYTSNIRWADKQHFVKLSEIFEQVQPAQFYAITALSLCE